MKRWDEMISWNEMRKTPEAIVDRIANIANRSDIRDAQELQVLEIREYAAFELDKIAGALIEMSSIDDDDQVFNYAVKKIAQVIHKRANSIREGK